MAGQAGRFTPAAIATIRGACRSMSLVTTVSGPKPACLIVVTTDAVDCTAEILGTMPTPQLRLGVFVGPWPWSRCTEATISALIPRRISIDHGDQRTLHGTPTPLGRCRCGSRPSCAPRWLSLGQAQQHHPGHLPSRLDACMQTGHAFGPAGRTSRQSISEQPINRAKLRPASCDAVLATTALP